MKLLTRVCRHSHKKKRIVIYMGAGAAIPWGGPLSSQIENAIIDDTKFMTVHDATPVSIGSKIFSILRDFYGNGNAVNFETFIGFLETVFDYVISKTNEGGTSPNETSFIPSFMNLNEEIIDNLRDYHIQPHNSDDNIVLYKSPKGTIDTPTQEKKDVVERIYFGRLLKHYLQIILDKIHGYSENINGEEYKDLNKKFRGFIEYLYSKNYTVRFYTTNYDRFLPDILNESYKVFDGFSDENSDELVFQNLPDSKRIFEDLNSLNYYNLHGSLYWKYSWESGYHYVCTPNDPQNYIDLNTTEITNPGHAIFPTNIVTGYNKLQRTSLEPMNQFSTIFEYDCSKADTILSIGTSYSDMHINRAISNATLNFSSKFIDVAKDEFYTGDKLKKLKDRFMENTISFPDTFENNCLISNCKNYKIYNNGFYNFLINDIWKKFL